MKDTARSADRPDLTSEAVLRVLAVGASTCTEIARSAGVRVDLVKSAVQRLVYNGDVEPLTRIPSPGAGKGNAVMLYALTVRSVALEEAWTGLHELPKPLEGVARVVRGLAA